MSATNRGAERAAADFYPTPQGTTDAFIRWARVNLPPFRRVVDPCAGDGAILRVTEQYGYECAGMEIRPEAAPDPGSHLAFRWGWQTADALDGAAVAPWRDNALGGEGAVVITNPPYSLAREFVEAWAPHAFWSAWLLRLNFAGSQRRAAWFRQHRPSHVLVLPKRPSFTGGGTDATEYAWFVWPGWGAQATTTTLDWLVTP